MVKKQKKGQDESNSETNSWLTEAYDYQPPVRGDIREGVILELDSHGAVVDVGLKYDGYVPNEDIEKLGDGVASELKPGEEVTAQVVRPKDLDGDLILSLAYMQEAEDWQNARQMFEQGEIWQGDIEGYNRGGLLTKFGQIEVFVPASHLWRQNRVDSQRTRLREYVGRNLSLKFIEVSQESNRLIASERKATEQLREQKLSELMNDVEVGQIRSGTVRHFTKFGAFVDLGGADGLIHISELSHHKVEHPSDVLQLGEEIEVYVLKIDRKRQRIGLSLKALQPDPWQTVDKIYYIDQLVSGTVTNVVDFGAFVVLGNGIEGLIHVSELADPPVDNPHDVVQPGDTVVVRILGIDAARRRIELSLKRVDAQDRDLWLAHQQLDRETAGEEMPEAHFHQLSETPVDAPDGDQDRHNFSQGEETIEELVVN